MKLNQRLIKRFAIVFAIVAALSVIFVMVFYEAGPWLMVQNKVPEKIDFIFTLGGDTERYAFAEKIALEHPEAFWVISTGWFPAFDTLRFSHIVRRIISDKGINQNRIIVNDTCTSTGSEILVFADYIRCAAARSFSMPVQPVSQYDSVCIDDKMRLVKWFSAMPQKDTLDCVVISNVFHNRRIKLWMKLKFKGLPVRIHMVPPPHGNNSELPGWKWWENEQDAEFVLLEYVKIAYYFTLRNFSGQK